MLPEQQYSIVVALDSSALTIVKAFVSIGNSYREKRASPSVAGAAIKSDKWKRVKFQGNGSPIVIAKHCQTSRNITVSGESICSRTN